MDISGIAIGQWNANCRNKEGSHRTRYKIRRAVVLGRVTHVYESRDYIVRYHDLNILVSHTGLVMMVWRDKSRQHVLVDESTKVEYDLNTTDKANIKNANKKHVDNIKKGVGVIEDEDSKNDTT